MKIEYFLIFVLFCLFVAIVISQEKPEVKKQTEAVQLDSVQVLILVKLDSIGNKITYLKLRDKQFTQYQAAVRYFNDTVLVIIQRAIDSLYIEKEKLKQ
jgi:hypothetical protein